MVVQASGVSKFLECVIAFPRFEIQEDLALLGFDSVLGVSCVFKATWALRGGGLLGSKYTN